MCNGYRQDLTAGLTDSGRSIKTVFTEYEYKLTSWVVTRRSVRVANKTGWQGKMQKTKETKTGCGLKTRLADMAKGRGWLRVKEEAKVKDTENYGWTFRAERLRRSGLWLRGNGPAYITGETDKLVGIRWESHAEQKWAQSMRVWTSSVWNDRDVNTTVKQMTCAD